VNLRLCGTKTIDIRPYFEEQKPLNFANFAVFGGLMGLAKSRQWLFWRSMKQMFHGRTALWIGADGQCHGVHLPGAKAGGLGRVLGGVVQPR
jgi:hypothetical protein